MQEKKKKKRQNNCVNQMPHLILKTSVPLNLSFIHLVYLVQKLGKH